MLAGEREVLRKRVYAARAKVFPEEDTMPIFLSESVLNQFTIGVGADADSKDHIPETPRANSHLAILAMVDSWASLNIRPFQHLSLAATPIFRMWIGVAQALYRSPERLDQAINDAIDDTSHRSDDLEFVIAARGWSQCVSFANFKLYEWRFEEVRSFFEPRFKEAITLGASMIKTILDDVTTREKELSSSGSEGSRSDTEGV